MLVGEPGSGMDVLMVIGKITQLWIGYYHIITELRSKLNFLGAVSVSYYII